MFTGIIETTGKVIQIETKGTNISFNISSDITNELKPDQSVAHNGVCLTVESVSDNEYKVTAIAETLAKTNMGLIKINDEINLERCAILGGRIDGHLVQGHVDCTATCVQKKDENGSVEYTFSYPEQFMPLMIEKGSVTVNGISLTCYGLNKNEFSVAVIPYTFEHTNIRHVSAGNVVNLEFDILGKYLLRWKELGMVK